MTRQQLALRTFGWAAVGFLLTNGVVLALGDAIDDGQYATGVKTLTLSGIAAVIAGIIAVLQSLRFPADTAFGKAASQFVQMLLAGTATLVVADLTEAAAIAFGTALLRLVVAAVLGGVQAYLVNMPRPTPPPPATA